MNEPTPVWVIHKIWSGDTSAKILLFTREQGLVQALFKGARTLKKQACLQEFTPLWGDLAERHGGYYVQKLEIASPGFQYSSKCLFSALYLNELLYHTLPLLEPHPQLYDAYQFTLEQLSQPLEGFDLERLLRRFEWTLLLTTGYSFSLTEEAHTQQAIIPTAFYEFHPGQGFLPSKQGILGQHILALAKNDLTDPAILKTAKHLMRQAIDHVLNGKRIKARQFFVKSSSMELGQKDSI